MRLTLIEIYPTQRKICLKTVQALTKVMLISVNILESQISEK